MSINKCQDFTDLEEVTSLNPDDKIICDTNGVDSEGNYIGTASVISLENLVKTANKVDINVTTNNKNSSSKNYNKKNQLANHNRITIQDTEGEDITGNSFIENFSDISEPSLRFMCVASSVEDTNIHYLTLNWEEIKNVIQIIALQTIADISTKVDELTNKVAELSDKIDNADANIDDLQTQQNDTKNRVDIIEPQVQENSLNIGILNEQVDGLVIPTSYTDIPSKTKKKSL